MIARKSGKENITFITVFSCMETLIWNYCFLFPCFGNTDWKKCFLFLCFRNRNPKSVFLVSLFPKHMTKLLVPVSLFRKQLMKSGVSCFLFRNRNRETWTNCFETNVSCRSLTPNSSSKSLSQPASHSPKNRAFIGWFGSFLHQGKYVSSLPVESTQNPWLCS